ncbi:integrase [Sphingomonas endophytica]|uniref:Integrase n=1 Tax=Sphingomonas endophytica TaxID=869719 RepID=A0ABR6N2L8_9SPHN|nr:integrase [Sphingomonas endophytica]
MADVPYTYVIRKPSGREYWRFRRGQLHTALPGKPGEVAFQKEYARLLELSQAPAPSKAAEGSFASLIAAYRLSAEFKALRPTTQKDYEYTLDLLKDELGDAPYRLVTQAMVKAIRDDLAATPRKAHKVKQMVSRLYSWAGEENLVKEGHNPAAKIKRLKVRAKTITPWSDSEIALFLAHAPAHLRMAVTLMLYTGQRVEDVASMEWTQYQGRFVRVRQSKTDEMLEVAVHPNLAALLDPVKIRRGRICKSAKGRPYTANALRKAISDQCAAIDGMPARSSHGLRYAAAGMLEEAGCTVGEITSVIGHRTYQMAMKYLTARRNSQAAMARISALTAGNPNS